METTPHEKSHLSSSPLTTTEASSRSPTLQHDNVPVPQTSPVSLSQPGIHRNSRGSTASEAPSETQSLLYDPERRQLYGSHRLSLTPSEDEFRASEVSWTDLIETEAEGDYYMAVSAEMNSGEIPPLKEIYVPGDKSRRESVSSLVDVWALPLEDDAAALKELLESRKTLKDKGLTLNRKEKTFTRIAFMALGVSSTCIFAAIVINLYALEHDLFSVSSRFGMWTHNIYALVVLITNLVFGSCINTNRLLLYSFGWLALSLVLGALTCAFFSVIAVLHNYYPLIATYPSIGLLLVMLCSFATGAIIPQSFSVATLLPGELGAAISVGQSLGSILTIILGLFSLLGGPLTSIFIVFSGCSLLCIFGLAMALILSSKTWMKASVEVAHRRVIQRRRKSSTSSAKTTASLYRRIWVPLFHVFFSFFVSFAIFPSVSTSFTNQGSDQANRLLGVIIMATFLLGDFLGRYTPAVGLLLPESILWLINLLRLGFIPLFRVMILSPHNSIWSSLWTISAAQFGLGFSNGWVASCAFIYGPHRVELPSEREKGNFFLAFYNVLGVVFGTLFMDLLVHIHYFSPDPPLS